MNQTLIYYNKNSQNLCEKYDLIDLSKIHNDILDFFKGYNTLLEIGSGSGRDMNFMINNGFDVTGIDGSIEMIREAQTHHPILKNKIVLSELPYNLPSFDKKFDGLFSIATFMHFNMEELNVLLQKLIKLLNIDSPVFITVSGSRGSKNANRFFLELPKDKWINLFKKYNFRVVGVKENQDYSDRKINWYTFFLKTGY